MIDIDLNWWVRARYSPSAWNPLWVLLQFHFAIHRTVGRWPGFTFRFVLPLCLLGIEFGINAPHMETKTYDDWLGFRLLPNITRKEGEFIFKYLWNFRRIRETDYGRNASYAS